MTTGAAEARGTGPSGTAPSHQPSDPACKGRTSVLLAATMVAAIVLRAAAVGGVEPAPTFTAGRADGAALYAAECASCHGESGKGDGVDAGLFVNPPPALDRAAAVDTDVLVRRILDGAGIGLVVDAGALRRRAERSEALVSHLRRLPTVNWPLAQRGRSLYAARCAGCHGPFGYPATGATGGTPQPRALADPAFHAATNETALLAAVRHARAGMPAPPEPIDGDDARALAAYVRMLSPGYETYERLCAACHGEEGTRGAPVAGGVPPAFDRAYMATHDTAALRAGVWHMLDDERPVMPHFHGVLGEAQARAIASFLRHR